MSRSNTIFTVSIEKSELINGEITTRFGKLNIVDLAGSERISKTGIVGNGL